MQFTPTQQRWLAWMALAGVAAWLVWWLGPVLLPFVVAALLAYALSPLVRSLDRLTAARVPRIVSVVLVEVLFLLLMTALGLLLVPVLAKELPQLREQLPTVVQRLDAVLSPWLLSYGIELRLDPASVKAFVLKHFSGSWEDVLDSLLSALRIGGSVALTLIGNAILIPVVLFYLLLDWDSVVTRVRDLVPPRWRSGVDSFLLECDGVLGQYIRGQLLVMVVLAFYYAVALHLFGLDLAWPIGVFTGLAICVPYLGYGLGLILALLAGLLQMEPMQAGLMIAVVYGLGQLIESFILTPRLVGERIGLHPLAVIFALLAFGQALGFVGVLIALPASAVLLVGWRRLCAHYQGSRLYLG
ncbi:MAG: AI-2E family transporter [Limnohabitans sp.]